MESQACPAPRQPLTDWLERLVESRTGGRIHGLHVEVEEGDVIITGRASTYYTKQLATHAVLEHVAGLELTNDIEVC